MSSRLSQLRLALLVVLLAPLAALAQNWTVVHTEGTSVMDEISKLTFQVTNTAGGSRPLSEITFQFVSANYDLDSAEAPTGWTATVNRSAKKVVFTANGGACPAINNNALTPGASAFFSVRLVGVAGAADVTGEIFVNSNKNSATFGRDLCASGGAVTFNNPTLRNATWSRVPLSAGLQVFPRMVALNANVTAQVVVDNRSTGAESNIVANGPTPIGTATFAVQGATTPASLNLAVGSAGVMVVPATATSNGTAVGQVIATGSASSQTAQALQVNVQPLAAALDVAPLQAFTNDTVALRVLVTNTSTNTYTNLVPRAPVSVGTAAATLVSGPVPASVASLAPGQTAQFTWQYQVSGAEGSEYQFQEQVDAKLSGSLVSSDVVDSTAGRLVLIRLTANPDAVLPGTSRAVRYTVENRGTEALLDFKLFKPAVNYFGTATVTAVPAGWTSSKDASGNIVLSGGSPLTQGNSLSFDVSYATVGTVTYDTPFLHRMQITRNGGIKSRLETTVTVAATKTVPEVQNFAVLSGDSRNTLIWTNPSDHNGVVVLRSTGSAPSVAPSMGVRYAVGDTVGTASVAYAGDLSGASRWADTAVVNGTDYFYRVYNFDDLHRYAAGNAPSSFGLKARPQARGAGAPLWCYTVGLSTLNQPITEAGVGIYSAFNNSVIANLFNTSTPAADGDERFRPVSLQGTIGSRFPVVPLHGLTGQYLLVGTQDGYMYALNSQTGAVLWTGDGGQSLGKIQSFPVTQLYDYANATYKAGPARDLVFFATRLDGNATGNKVIALDAATGARVWLYQPGDLDMVSGGMMVDYTNNLLVLAARSNGNTQASLRILNTMTGQEVARLSLGDIDFSVVRLAATGQALVTANDGTVSGVGLTSYKVEWSMKLPSVPTNYARPQGRGFFATLSSGAVEYYLLQTQADGSTVPTRSWTTPVASPSGSFSYLLNSSTSRVYVGSSDGKVHELDGTTGADLKQVSLGSAQRIGMPTVDSTVGRLHVGTQDGRVCAFQVPFQ